MTGNAKINKRKLELLRKYTDTKNNYTYMVIKPMRAANNVGVMEKKKKIYVYIYTIK